MRRYEFAGEEYIAAFHGYLRARVPDIAHELGGAEFSISEVYSQVPRPDGREARVAISWGVRDGKLRFSTAEWTDALITVTSDWATLLPMVREMMSPDVRRMINEAVDQGRMTIRRSIEPPAFLASVHDGMVELTA